MSLAMYAAPFENDNNSNNKNNKTHKSNPRGHNTTQKASRGKVSVLLEQIHSQNDNGDNEEGMNNLADFDPIPKPESIGVNKTIERELPVEEGDSSVEPTDKLASQYAKQYYQQYAPSQPNYNAPQSYNNEQNKLFDKMNYMIHLLEEQQDQKTNHVTEEIILYSFLGVFVIFVVDSFARVGKYVR
jgi:hypothetical protein